MTIEYSDRPSADTTEENGHVHIEEMACAISEAQAALFEGRFNDLEICAWRLQQLCASLKQAVNNRRQFMKMQGRSGSENAAHCVHRQNRVFGATLRRMRGHLAILRNLLNGPSATYQPKIIPMPEGKS
ncbi:MAG TPA: hypothetical protein VH596_12140 [Terriglobales bacterium]